MWHMSVQAGSQVTEAAGEAIGETIGGMFDIPYNGFIENLEDDLTLGSSSAETGKLDTPPDPAWDPFEGW
jgi:hypothetical protein